MALRTRLFLFFGTLIAVLVSAELWLVRALVDDLEEEVGELALEVGSSFLHFLGAEEPAAQPAPPGPRPDGPRPDGHGRLARVDQRGEREMGSGIFVLRMRQHEVLVAEPELVMVEGGALARVEVQRELGLDEEDIEHVHRELVRSHHPVHERLIRRVLGDDESFTFETDGGHFENHDAWFESLGGDDVQVHLALKGHRIFDADEDLSLEIELSPSSGSWVRRPPIARIEELEVTEAAAPEPSGGAARAQPARASASIPIPRQGLVNAVESFLSRLLLGSAGILVLGLLVAGYAAHRVSEPLQGLARAAQRVGDGELGTQVPSEGDREVRATISAFNAMSTQLADLDHEARSLREREHLFEMGEVARGLAHSLRNPLNVLGLTVDQLAGDEAPELATSARAQIQRIDRTLRTFLSLSSGGGQPEIVAVDDLARDVALELVQDCAARAVVRVEADGPVPMCAVGPELRAVLHVLVVNAVEAGPQGVEVLVRVAPTAAGARCEVLDRGAGLAPEVRARLFTPHTTTKEQGAGMGLYLAERIARSRYAGTLTLTARSGGGTRAVLEVQSLGEGACG